MIILRLMISDIVNEPARAWYDIEKNKIHYFDSKYIYHELFHAISSNISKENKIYNIGFSKIIKNACVGRGINEGYTEYLTKKYFYDKNQVTAYSIEVFIVSRIEEIIGDKKMEKYYFESDLPSLVEELNKYMSIEEIDDFIFNVDNINITSNINKIIDNLHQSMAFLVKCILKKAKQDFETKKIRINEYVDKIIECKKYSKAKIGRCGKIYPMCDEENINIIIDEIITNDENEILKQSK